MPEVICDTSPLLYLHQLGLLEVLHALAGRIIVPTAVVDELAGGKAAGFDLPEVSALDWAEIRTPKTGAALPLATDLGAGERQVLALGLEQPDAVLVLDDRRGRQMAEYLGLKHTGTLGILLDAKRAGLVEAVAPLLDRLQELRFRLAPTTRAAVLELADEK